MKSIELFISVILTIYLAVLAFGAAYLNIFDRENERNENRRNKVIKNS